VLKENKKDRIVLLTTHSMEEAQKIGDQIGVLADGKISTAEISEHVKFSEQTEEN